MEVKLRRSEAIVEFLINHRLYIAHNSGLILYFQRDHIGYSRIVLEALSYLYGEDIRKHPLFRASGYWPEGNVEAQLQFIEELLNDTWRSVLTKEEYNRILTINKNV